MLIRLLEMLARYGDCVGLLAGGLMICSDCVGMTNGRFSPPGVDLLLLAVMVSIVAERRLHDMWPLRNIGPRFVHRFSLEALLVITPLLVCKFTILCGLFCVQRLRMTRKRRCAAHLDRVLCRTRVRRYLERGWYATE